MVVTGQKAGLVASFHCHHCKDNRNTELLELERTSSLHPQLVLMAGVAVIQVQDNLALGFGSVIAGKVHAFQQRAKGILVLHSKKHSRAASEASSPPPLSAESRHSPAQGGNLFSSLSLRKHSILCLPMSKPVKQKRFCCPVTAVSLPRVEQCGPKNIKIIFLVFAW